MNIKKIKAPGYGIILLCCIALYIAAFSFLSIKRNLSFNSHYYDLGIMNQVAFNTSRGHFLEMTNQDLSRNASRLAIHFDPILAFFAPFYWIWAGPEVLLIGQTIIIAFGSLAVYLLSKLMIKEKFMSFLFAISYLGYFAVQRQTLFDFHAITLATSFLLFAIYCAYKKSNGLAYAFILLSLLTKENVGLVTFLLGLYFFWFHKNRRFGITVMVTSVVFFVGAVFLIIPYFRQGAHFALKYYGDFGDSPSAIILNIIKHPFHIVAVILEQDRLVYLGTLLLTYGLFIVFSPIPFLLSLPEFLINLLSASPNMRVIYFHYNAILVPFMIFSAISGYAYIKKRWAKRPVIVGFFIGLFCMCNLISMYLFNPVPYGLVQNPASTYNINTTKLAAVRMWSARLSDSNIKVATSPQLAPFFTDHRYYYNFLFDPAAYDQGYTDGDIIKGIDNYEKADYVIVSRSELHDDQAILKEFHDHLQGNPKYHRIYDKNDLEVYTNDLNRYL